MRDKTLMKRAGKQGDAVLVNLITKVLTGDTDLWWAGWFENIQLKKIPFLSRARRWHGESSRHRTRLDTPVLLLMRWFGQMRGTKTSTSSSQKLNTLDRSSSSKHNRGDFSGWAKELKVIKRIFFRKSWERCSKIINYYFLIWLKWSKNSFHSLFPSFMSTGALKHVLDILLNRCLL